MKKLNYFLSYLWDVPLEKRTSPYNESLEVVLSRGRIRLDTENATYSYEDLYRVFYNSFIELEIDKQRFDKVLILGAGLGSIPVMLERNFRQNAQYTAVEIDQVVIELAKRYMPPEVSSKVQFECTDAALFVEGNTAQYDLIAVDVFIDQITPSLFFEKEFWESIKMMLSPNALVLFNTLAYNLESQKKSQVFFEEVFKIVFPNSETFQTTGNKMLYAIHN